MDFITISFENNSNIPLYIQLYNYLKKEIEVGNLKANSKLPSKRKLSKHLQISQNTIEAAYEQLIIEGYIISLPKKGYFVCELEEVFKGAETIEEETIIKKE